METVCINNANSRVSDVQLMILDNSNDLDTSATQRRISAHLRGRNRRHDRLIHVPYLRSKHSHKG